jgi:hypothetical protein
MFVGSSGIHFIEFRSFGGERSNKYYLLDQDELIPSQHDECNRAPITSGAENRDLIVQLYIGGTQPEASGVRMFGDDFGIKKKLGAPQSKAFAEIKSSATLSLGRIEHSNFSGRLEHVIFSYKRQ